MILYSLDTVIFNKCYHQVVLFLIVQGEVGIKGLKGDNSSVPGQTGNRGPQGNKGNSGFPGVKGEMVSCLFKCHDGTCDCHYLEGVFGTDSNSWILDKFFNQHFLLFQGF